MFVINGQPTHQPLASTNRSFRFGDGVFESMRRLNGRIPFLAEHLARLNKGMQMLHMQPLQELTMESIESAANRLAYTNNCGTGGRLRLSVWRKGDGAYLPTTNEVEWMLECMPMPNEEAFNINEQGERLTLYPHMQKPHNLLADIKSANGLLYVLAALHAKQAGFSEALILNSFGRLCEASSSNFFLLKDRTLITPSLTEDCLPGIMRKVLLQLAQTDGLVVQERAVLPEELNTADEVILTNAVQGIRWVVAWQRSRYFKKWSTRATQLLNQEVLARAQQAS